MKTNSCKMKFTKNRSYAKVSESIKMAYTPLHPGDILAKSAAARKSLIAYPGHKLKQFTVADDSKSLPDKNPTTK